MGSVAAVFVLLPASLLRNKPWNRPDPSLILQQPKFLEGRKGVQTRYPLFECCLQHALKKYLLNTSEY